ncbi:TonB-dependent receptor domain-containing protein [Solitalea koreensis]|uniref:Fe(3+) dicitrate transport protein n=1 Tax=Solitalea koreensis TaxID=543615 RepID=A0A521E7S7_9SPHI|nr:TonB-dependent receptor [Solitalea koreensis]SMO79993.1 Fe(3+) dicitrate transport protein [Solitalea koreensis]
MIRLKAFSILFFTFLALHSAAQVKVLGKVNDAVTKEVLPNVVVVLKPKNAPSKVVSKSDKEGRFIVNNLSDGTYDFVFSLLGYSQFSKQVVISGKDIQLDLSLSEIQKDLEEVQIKDKNNEFGIGRLRSVENMAIFAGKKSELIIPENMTVNLATNNARQLYSRVAGLNIYENDGAGLQLSIGGRGLDPNRTANFNVRQNGYDISADALGYPESYYTPPVEAIDRIQIVRGAASLQYGTQFGGLLNFIMKKPVEDKPIEVVTRQSGGSFGFFNSFNSISGTTGKLGYYAFFQYKQGDGFRPNSNFNAYTGYINLKYQVTENTSVNGQYTHMNYLAQQAGGLTDKMFYADPLQSNRERNWFNVNWNLFDLELEHKLSERSKIAVQGFGLVASRESLGFRPNRPATPDNGGPRDLIDGKFTNWGIETRFLNRYMIKELPSVLLLGTRYYEGLNRSKQGAGSDGSDADFKFVNKEDELLSDYRFPNKNIALFGENVFNLSSKFSITPGFRFEYIRTISDGYYRNIATDLAGNVILNEQINETQNRPRSFMLLGLGASYKPKDYLELYANASQNYRSITFNDIRIVNPSFTIDPNIKDENGYSADIGIRGNKGRFVNYDISAFAMKYGDRIGEVQFDDGKFVKRKRANIGNALIVGVESYSELNLMQVVKSQNENLKWSVFGNLAFIKSEYTESQLPGVKGKEVEFVPDMNLKTGMSFGYKGFKTSFQYSYLSEQFTDATNALIPDPNTGTIGVIPKYYIMDFSASYDYKFLRFEGSVNNLANQIYYTRRATGYPGPGILPSDGRSFYLTIQARF